MSTNTGQAIKNAEPSKPLGQANPAGASMTSQPNDDRINILLVDDEPKNLTVLESVLNDPQYRLVCAESAEKALLARWLAKNSLCWCWTFRCLE